MDTRGVSLARNKRSGSRLVCVAPRLSANSTWQWSGGLCLSNVSN